MPRSLACLLPLLAVAASVAGCAFDDRALDAGKGGTSAVKGLLKAIQPQLLATRLLQGEVD